jgi:hypothetical protein
MGKKKQKGGGDFWGEVAAEATPAAAPVSDEPQIRETGPRSRRGLLGLLEPILRYVAEQHRIARGGGTVAFSRVRDEVEHLLKELERAAAGDRGLNAQYKEIQLPLLWYVDYWFGTSHSFPQVRNEWNNDRLSARDEQNLIGDEAFFDWLGRLMQEENSPGTNELLAFYYVALGLGFRGKYRETGMSPEQVRKDSETINDLMLKMYPRVKDYVDAAPASEITPEHRIDKTDFVRPVREKPMAIFLAILTFFALMAMGYFYLYGDRKVTLEQMIKDVGSSISSRGNP